MGVFNVWNHEEIDNLLSGLAEGDGEISRYLNRYIRPILLCHGPAMEELGELPQSAPGWLRAKWNGGRGEMFYTFSANKDPGLENRLIHIRDWIRAGRNNGEEWLKRHDPDAPLPRLREEGTIDRAYEMAEEYFSALRDEFDPETIGEDGPGDIREEMAFPGGWKIVRLLTPEALDRESAHMQHCIGKGAYDHHLDSGDHVFYSLRDPKNLPHATMEAVHEDGIAKLIQCRGKQNALLMEKYYDYTISFVRERGLEPPRNPNAAGIIKHDGEYHTIYRLPEGYETFRLYLSSLHTPPVLPKGLKIRDDLLLNAEDAPQIPEDCEIGRHVVFYWKKGGKYHREGGPAIMEIDPQTGVVTWEAWNKDGKRHREDGPAAIWRDSNTGEITRRTWYLNGKLVTPEQTGDYSYRKEEPALEAA
jgi:hypothetical protein